MKRIILLLACAGLAFHPLLAQNPCTVADFTTQASVASFGTDHPGCTQISNSVRIAGAGINSLAGLAAVTSMGGLDIDGTGLTNLTGLGALATMGGNLRIANNASLTSIAALSNITTVTGFLSVGVNAVLPNLTGLEHVTTIVGQLFIGSNNGLANLNGLAGITKINGILTISGNPALTSITGLMGLTSLSTSTPGSTKEVRILDNDALTSLSGLDNIGSANIAILTIQNSSVLSVCGVRSICEFLSSGIGTAVISNNMTGCQTAQEVSASGACVALPVNLISFSGKSTGEGNVLKWVTASEVNNLGFAVERSSNSRIFEQIGYVTGNGSTSVTNNYSFTDGAPATITYYRLKQMDTDTKFTYSSIIAVKASEQIEAVAIYPNPSEGQLFIKAKDANQSFKIQTSTGVTVQEAESVPTKPIDTTGMKNGLYLVTVGEETFKVMVVN